MMAGDAVEALATQIRACRICRDRPGYGPPLPHEPRPLLQVSATARLCIASQAPGVRAHDSGVPFSDPSGVRLRAWMGVTEAEFYDPARVAIVPMGFCFPGTDASGGDLPPRRECAQSWHDLLFAQLPQLQLLLLIGRHAQLYHMGPAVARQSLGDTVREWRCTYRPAARVRRLPLPHPSWRNSGWLKRNPWFEEELLPVLRADVRTLLG